MTPPPNESIFAGENRAYRAQQLHRIFENNLLSSNCGNKPALIYNDNRNDDETILTHNQLNHAANRLAATLIDQIRTLNLKPNGDGDYIVAVCMPPSDELVIALLAVMKAGAAYVPIDVTFPKSRIDHILQDAKPALVIYDSESIERCDFNYSTAISYDECKDFASEFDNSNILDEEMLCLPSPNSLALVLYTSGSTGIPKGVRLPHAVVMNRLQWQWETFPYSETEQIGVFKTALTFVDSVSEVWGPLLSERSLLVVPKCVMKDPSQLVAILDKYEIERLVLVPTLLKSLLLYLSFQQDASLLRKLKLWVCSGEALPVSLVNEFYDYFPENEYLLCNFYGSTEIMGDVTYFPCYGKEQISSYTKGIPIGSPIFNTGIYILDADRNPVKFGEIGELFVSGANLAHGYVNGREKDRFIDNKLSSDSDHSRLYRTGDFASMQSNGVIEYEGRTDSQLKIRGNRVDLSEIEKHLCAVSGVNKALVLCCQTAKNEQIIVAFALVEPDLLKSDIESALHSKLPEYMVPQVMIVDEMPLLVNGKIDRQLLLKMYKNKAHSGSAADWDFSGVAENEMKMAKILFETIDEVIGISNHASLSLKSDFYALGGNSMNSIYTIAKLRDHGYSVKTTDFILAKSLRDILDCMTDSKSKIDANASPSESKGEYVVEPLLMEHKEAGIHILAKSFSDKGLLYKYIRPKATYADFAGVLEPVWEIFVRLGYSFIVKDLNGNIIGVSLNHEMHEELDIAVPRSILQIQQFFADVENQARELLPKGKLIWASYKMGTHESLSAQQNIAVITLMESEIIRMGKEKKCCGIITTNTSALTQQLATYVFNYETMIDIQLNKHTFNAMKPYAAAPDTDHLIVQWRNLDD